MSESVMVDTRIYRCSQRNLQKVCAYPFQSMLCPSPNGVMALTLSKVSALRAK